MRWPSRSSRTGFAAGQHVLREARDDRQRHDAELRALSAGEPPGRARAGGSLRGRRLGDGRRQRQPRVVQGPGEAARGGDRHHRHRRAQGRARDRGRDRDRRADHAHRDRAGPADPRAVPHPGRCGAPGREPADPQQRHDRRQRLAGRPLLVLPLRPAVLPGRRQHLLRRHARGHEPGACAVRRRPLRRRDPVGHRAGAGGARGGDAAR